MSKDRTSPDENVNFDDIFNIDDASIPSTIIEKDPDSPKITEPVLTSDEAYRFLPKEERKKLEKEKKAEKETIELKWWIKYIILFIVVVIASEIFFTKVLIWGSVPSSSMAPTLNVGDVVFCNGLAYVKHEPQRGDIIVFTSRLKGYEGETITKRIIGLPGDDLMFIDGYIYLNGELVYEEYISPEIETNSFADFIVPEGCYFVMGDNRENSYDSREWDDPYVRKEDIRGKVMVNIPIEKLKNTVKTMFNTTERE